MARKTEALKIQNPHTSIHFGTSLPCEECHKEHRISYNYCTEACHRTWPNKFLERDAVIFDRCVFAK